MTTLGITDSLGYKNLPLIATAGLAAAATISAIAVPIILAPLAINAILTEVASYRMNAFKASPEEITHFILGTLAIAFISTIFAFVYLSVPLALIFGISAVVVSINNFNHLDKALEADEENYLQRFRSWVIERDNELREKVQKTIIHADEQLRKDNEKLFEMMTKYLKDPPRLPLDFKTIKECENEINALLKELKKLSAPA